jgi:1-acyl-sn-glycerol-3-phosphate acyltransferase
MLSDILYWIAWNISWFFTHVVCRYHVRGVENMPPSGPLLIVANHLSWYDPFLIGVILPRRLWFCAKVELFSWPLFGWACKQTGQIPVRRGKSDRASLEKALAYLREGKAVVIFPEGKVEKHGRMIEAHTGIAMLALRSGAKLLPIAHTGLRPRLFGWLNYIFPRGSVRIGMPFTPQIPTSLSHREVLRFITQDVMERIASMLPSEQRGIYYLTPSDLTPTRGITTIWDSKM